MRGDVPLLALEVADWSHRGARQSGVRMLLRCRSSRQTTAGSHPPGQRSGRATRLDGLFELPPAICFVGGDSLWIAKERFAANTSEHMKTRRVGV